MLLAVDIGNTKTATAALLEGRVVERGPRGMVDAALEWCMRRMEQGDVRALVLASVVPAATERWRQLWAATSTTRPPLHVIDETTPRPFPTRIERTASVGADRWCNVAGAWARGHRDALVVDLGTANTYDILLAGVFVGGLIAPGLGTAHRALLRAGARLPELPFAAADGWEAITTEAAIAAGSWHQGVGGVTHVLAGLRERHGALPVLLTGGLAASTAGSLPFATETLPDLTLEGAAALSPDRG